ncbi:MAG: transporter substrate-binding domain-containing protein [Deltaproteobacteria bacterium]|nr:transporter substrate-binding domain-containing protein [Deltaproteobacteria bacterium]
MVCKRERVFYLLRWVYQNRPKIFLDQAGKAAGFYIDLLDYIVAKEGWRLEYVPGTWQECLERLENGGLISCPQWSGSFKRTWQGAAGSCHIRCPDVAEVLDEA